MSEPFQPSGRFHRVTTRRRNLRVLQCPLESELLVAEFAGELPPEVAIAVREHIAVCEICGARSLALRKPYQVIASLGNEPVPYVPDLRDKVRVQLRHGRASRRFWRLAGSVARGGGLVAVCAVAAVALIGFLIFGIISASAQNLGPSSNQFSHVPSAGHGVLLAETDKLITVTAADGTQWQVAEVIAVNLQDGTVLHSLPSSNGPLHPSKPQQLPVATQVSPDGQTVYEVTAPNPDHQQALVAFNSRTGNLAFITPLRLPGNLRLPEGDYADTLAVAPDGTTVYVGLGLARPNDGGVRVLTYTAASGRLAGAMSPAFTPSSIPEPPPPGSLPVSVFPGEIPHLDASSYNVRLGAGGQMVVSNDGNWLYDEELLSKGGSPEYAVIRRISTATGQTAQELAIPGDFKISQMAITTTAQVPQLYLIKSSPDCMVYVLDPSDQGPTVSGLIDLGGVEGASGVVFTGTVSLGPTNGTQLYATQNISADNGTITGQDLWLLDTQAMTVEAHLLDNSAAGSVLANPTDHYTAAPFILRNGVVLLAPNSLQGEIVPWLSLSDGHPILALLAVGNNQ